MDIKFFAIEHLLEVITILVGLSSLTFSSYAIVALVRERREKWPWRIFPYYYQRRRSHVRDVVSKFIFENERQFSMSLTPASREMLILPVEEAFELGIKTDFDEVQRSIAILMEAMSFHSKDAPHHEDLRERGTQEVVKAFYTRFCKIPPFCDGRERLS